jgi:DNA-binding MarR family transcriptional regulator
LAEVPVIPPTPALLQIAYNSLARGIFGAVAASGFSDLRPSHGNVLEPLSYVDGLRLGELAERAGMTAQSMGELVDDLERLGYVERRPDPADRRAKRVHLTRKGRVSRRAAAAAATRTEKELKEIVGTASYRHLRELLSRIVSANATNGKSR